MDKLPLLVRALVRAHIRRAGVSQRWIGEQLGLSQPQVSQRIHGHVEWRNSELEALARALDVPVSDFLPTDRTEPAVDELAAATAAPNRTTR